MKSKSMLTILIITVVLSLLCGWAISAQDKYTVKVPGGLAFAEFKGYEAWQAISISRSEKAVAVILGNPAMIGAYQAGIPGNGKPVPDGAKMAKVHWMPKQLVKVECSECGYTLRTTKKWLEEKGSPICPCNMQPMQADGQTKEESDGLRMAA